jgi:hypothetical protein
MKILLAVIFSTVFTASVFAGECSLTSPVDCTTKATCEGLSTANGQKFSFNEKTSKCMVKEAGLTTTDCTKNNDGKYGKANQSADEKKAADAKAAATK